MTTILTPSVFSDIGANPSAEEQEEALDEGTKQDLDIVVAFRLVPLGDKASGDRGFNKKADYQGQLKGMSAPTRKALGCIHGQPKSVVDSVCVGF